MRKKISRNRNVDQSSPSLSFPQPITFLISAECGISAFCHGQVSGCMKYCVFMYLWKTRQLVTFGSVPKHSWLVHICFLGISAHLHIQVHGCTQSSAHHTLRMSRPSAPGGGGFDYCSRSCLTRVRKRWSLLCSYLDAKCSGFPVEDIMMQKQMIEELQSSHLY